MAGASAAGSGFGSGQGLEVAVEAESIAHLLAEVAAAAESVIAAIEPTQLHFGVDSNTKIIPELGSVVVAGLLVLS